MRRLEETTINPQLEPTAKTFHAVNSNDVVFVLPACGFLLHYSESKILSDPSLILRTRWVWKTLMTPVWILGEDNRRKDVSPNEWDEIEQWVEYMENGGATCRKRATSILIRACKKRRLAFKPLEEVDRVLMKMCKIARDNDPSGTLDIGYFQDVIEKIRDVVIGRAPDVRHARAILSDLATRLKASLKPQQPAATLEKEETRPPQADRSLPMSLADMARALGNMDRRKARKTLEKFDLQQDPRSRKLWTVDKSRMTDEYRSYRERIEKMEKGQIPPK